MPANWLQVYLRLGQEIVALPYEQHTTVKEILLHTQNLQEAVPSQSIVLTTTDHIDLGRGDMIVCPKQDADSHDKNIG